MLLDASYFVGELNIPTSNAAATERLDFFIKKYEAEVLEQLLGYSLYKQLNADGTAQRMLDITDGKEYTDNGQRLRMWKGLRNSEAKRSFLANYVYYYWLRDKASITQENGEMALVSEGAQRVSPALKMARAWNEASSEVIELVIFLNHHADVYPEWAQQDVSQVLNDFRAINTFGI